MYVHTYFNFPLKAVQIGWFFYPPNQIKSVPCLASLKALGLSTHQVLTGLVKRGKHTTQALTFPLRKVHLTPFCFSLLISSFFSFCDASLHAPAQGAMPDNHRL